MPRLPQRLSRLTAVAAVAISPFAAQAQYAYTPPPLRDSSSPYYLSVSQSYTHDSNVFRLADNQSLANGSPRDDNIWTTGLRLGLEQPISRQRIFADALIRYNKYDHQSQLSNTSYGVNLRGEFQTVNNISGDVHYTRSEYQAMFEDNRSVALVTTRNRLSTNEAGLRVQYGMYSKWILEGTALYRDQSYSAVQYQYQDQRETTLGLAAKYRPSDVLTLGVGVRASSGDLPNYQAVAGGPTGDSYDRQDIDLLGTWKVSGRSTLNGRISATHSKHDLATERNFTGITGELGANYQVSGRLNLDANLSRDTNDTGTLYSSTLPSGAPSSTRLADTRVIDALRLAANYDLTGKIRLNGAVRYVYRNLKGVGIVNGDGSLNSIQNGTDRTVGVAIGATYTITRAWSASCSIGHDRRRTDLANAIVTYPYSVTTASCSAQLTLR